jgi:YggT family protein
MRELLLVVEVITHLYLSLFIVRFWGGWVRADFRNPVLISVVAYTQPVLRPARRWLPPWGRWDIALISVVLVIDVVLQCVIRSASVGIFILNFNVLWHALTDVVDVALSLGLMFCIGYSLLSWLVPDDPYLPVARFFRDLLGPFLAPLRRLLPQTPGVDFSPMMLMLIIWIIRTVVSSL